MTHEKPCLDRSTLVEVTGGDRELERQLFRHFMRVSSGDAAGLRRAISQRDCEQAALAAHRLRGASSTLGAAALAEACRRLERAAREGRMDLVEAHIGTFEEQLGRVVDYLSKADGDAD
jgi:HPt (histidine-containing phosphotransfer) domain-containing protein